MRPLCGYCDLHRVGEPLALTTWECAMTDLFLTRKEVAERYPISAHTLARLASEGRGPIFYKPTDKALYRPADIEDWIRSAAVTPARTDKPPHRPPSGPGAGRGKARPASQKLMRQAPGAEQSDPSGRGRPRKSLPLSERSALRGDI